MGSSIAFVATPRQAGFKVAALPRPPSAPQGPRLHPPYCQEHCPAWWLAAWSALYQFRCPRLAICFSIMAPLLASLTRGINGLAPAAFGSCLASPAKAGAAQ